MKEFKVNDKIVLKNQQYNDNMPVNKDFMVNIFYNDEEIGLIDGRYINLEKNKEPKENKKTLKDNFYISKEYMKKEIDQLTKRLISPRSENFLNKEIVKEDINNLFYLSRIIIDREYRGRGFGTEIMSVLPEIIEHFLYKTDFIVFSIYPLRENIDSFQAKKDLVNLYSRCGYRKLPGNNVYDIFYMCHYTKRNLVKPFDFEVYGDKQIFFKVYENRINFYTDYLVEREEIEEIDLWRLEGQQMLQIIDFFDNKKEAMSFYHKYKDNKNGPKIISYAIKENKSGKVDIVGLITTNNIKFGRKYLAMKEIL